MTNLREDPSGFELVYHWNFGPPQLEEGSRFQAPIKTVCPRDARAVEGLGHLDVYGPPEPGFTEQVYFFELLAGKDGRTVVLLRNRAGDQGVALRYSVEQLPCFTLWKSTQGIHEGYVTGLEPGVNYPNPKPFEASHGRVRTLKPGASHVAETVFEVLSGADAVKAVEEEVAEIQSQARPNILGKPTEPFGPRPIDPGPSTVDHIWVSHGPVIGVAGVERSEPPVRAGPRSGGSLRSTPATRRGANRRSIGLLEPW